MNTNKPKYSLFDKIMFPVLNILMLTLVFALLSNLFEPQTYLEWTAIILMSGLSAMPIAQMNRKEFKEHVEIEEIMKREASGRKGA